MNSALQGSVSIVGYLALFAGIGLLFVFVNLFIGRFLRPKDPHGEKLEIYECGEPTIGSSFVQFDLRFYIVALIFIVFDVEVAFLFPWATVFGKANHLSALAAEADADAVLPAVQGLARELGDALGPITAGDVDAVAAGGQALGRLASVEVLVFFLILLVGYAYVWGTGALDWIRTQPAHDEWEKATTAEKKQVKVAGSPVLSA
jgi:NADH-quinone oxidoreductase subunit A